jgi:Protein of unknown function (DUF3450)
MCSRIRLGMVSLAALWLGTVCRAETPLAETRSTLGQWVAARQLISKTKADWQADKALLQQTVALYERELKATDEQMSNVSTNNTQVEKERLEAEALQASSRNALNGARVFAAQFEARIQELVPRLPAPLQDILRKDLARIPSNPADTKMLAAERMQILVGILNEIDKFNNALNVFSERRKNAQGEEVAVETLYVGLGAAYFVNDSGDFAGLGAPGAKGWEWTLQPELAPTVKAAVKMYRNERTAQFVTLPVAIR